MAGIRQFEEFLSRRYYEDEWARHALVMLKEFRTTVPKNRRARRATSRAVDDAICEQIVKLDAAGYSQHRIAATLNVNQGRVNEVLKGKR